jgi:hypothetical protein
MPPGRRKRSSGHRPGIYAAGGPRCVPNRATWATCDFQFGNHVCLRSVVLFAAKLSGASFSCPSWGTLIKAGRLHRKCQSRVNKSRKAKMRFAEGGSNVFADFDVTVRRAFRRIFAPRSATYKLLSSTTAPSLGRRPLGRRHRSPPLQCIPAAPRTPEEP